MSFENDLSILDDLEKEINQEIRQVSTAVLHGLVKKTPKGKPSTWKSAPPPDYVPGAAKGNWFVRVAASFDILSSPPRLIDITRRRSNSLAEGAVNIALAKNVKFPTIVISNNLSYIERLNDGWSKQAPALFVEQELQKVQNG